MKIRDVVQMLEDDGWFQVRMRGSHRQFKHPRQRGLVTVPGKPGDDLATGTLNGVLKQARIARGPLQGDRFIFRGQVLVMIE